MSQITDAHFTGDSYEYSFLHQQQFLLQQQQNQQLTSSFNYNTFANVEPTTTPPFNMACLTDYHQSLGSSNQFLLSEWTLNQNNKVPIQQQLLQQQLLEQQQQSSSSFNDLSNNALAQDQSMFQNLINHQNDGSAFTTPALSPSWSSAVPSASAPSSPVDSSSMSFMQELMSPPAVVESPNKVKVVAKAEAHKKVSKTVVSPKRSVQGSKGPIKVPNLEFVKYVVLGNSGLTITMDSVTSTAVENGNMTPFKFKFEGQYIRDGKVAPYSDLIIVASFPKPFNQVFDLESHTCSVDENGCAVMKGIKINKRQFEAGSKSRGNGVQSFQLHFLVYDKSEIVYQVVGDTKNVITTKPIQYLANTKNMEPSTIIRQTPALQIPDNLVMDQDSVALLLHSDRFKWGPTNNLSIGIFHMNDTDNAIVWYRENYSTLKKNSKEPAMAHVVEGKGLKKKENAIVSIPKCYYNSSYCIKAGFYNTKLKNEHPEWSDNYLQF